MKVTKLKARALDYSSRCLVTVAVENFPDYRDWLSRLALHGNGIALVFARTETKSFFSLGLELRPRFLWLKGRLAFYSKEGRPVNNNAAAPSVLIAYGQENAHCLKTCGLEGHYLENNRAATIPV